MKRISHLVWSLGISLWLFTFIFKTSIYDTLIYSFLVSFFSSIPDIDIKIINFFKNLNSKTFFITYNQGWECPIFYQKSSSNTEQ